MKCIYNKYNLLIFCCLHCFLNVWGQNNDIFRSDTIASDGYDSEHFIQLTNNPIFGSDTITGDGYDSESFIQLTNNDIFVGDGADGYDQTGFIQLTNNNIFIGDGADGYDQTSFVQLTNNPIFGSDTISGDGYDSESFVQLTSNDIFGGGIADGYDLSDFIQPTNNNGIFSGGVADGYELTGFVQLVNNGIFGGGISDGYDMEVTLIEIIQSFSVFNPLDIESVRKTNELTFNSFPTPFSNYLNVNIPESENNLLLENKLSLVDSKGSIVKAYPFKGTNIRIDASKLPAGLYILIVQTQDKIFKSQVVKIGSTVND